MAHPDAAVCQEQEEAHLALSPCPDAADSRRNVAHSWDADHDAVRPAVTMDKVDAILGDLPALRAVDAGK